MEKLFENAKQIFIKNCREKVNFQAGFRCKFNAMADREYELHITGATLYSIYLNGVFIFYGPARAAHRIFACGYFKVTGGGRGKCPLRQRCGLQLPLLWEYES